MKRWVRRLLLLGVLGTVGFWLWSWLFPSPEQVIRKELAELATTASVPANEAPIARLANIQRLANFFTSDARVAVDVPGRALQTLNGREEILQASGYARSMLNSFRVQFVDVLVRVDPDKRSARAHLTATAVLPGEKIPEVQELDVSLKRTDNDWYIDRLETVKTLR